MHVFFLVFFLMFQKNKQALGAHLSTRLKLHSSMIDPSFELQECYLIHSLQLFLTGSSALLKAAHVLADKPVNFGNSAGLLDFFLESV